jgi:ribosomal protein S18 acetylase RimI-like enzyme
MISDPLDRIAPPVRAGERIVVRHRLPDSSATDVVGWLETREPHLLEVRDVAGTLHRIDRASVVAARRAPAARGGPGPLRTSPEELEQVAVDGWAAEQQPLGEWTLRAAGGFTGRANSALAVGDPGLPFAEAARRVQAFSAARGITPRAQVIEASPQEHGLRALGWVEDYVPTDVLVTRLAELLGSTPPDPRVRVTEQLEPDWEVAFGVSRPNSAEPDVVRRILDGVPPRAFGGVEHEGGLIAIGRGHVSADWVGLASLWTDPGHRRRGWASAVLRSLGHWAARGGARNAYLQVAAENESAHRAYERLGFVFHHRYRYLSPPD